MHWHRILSIAALLAVASLPVAASGKTEPTLTEAQAAAVRAEVMQAVKPLIAATERLDIDAAMNLCLKWPEFTFAMPDGTLFGFDELRATAKEMFAALSAQKMTTQKERVIVLAADLALYVWQGRSDMIQKDGVILRSEPYCCTYLYRKVDGQWKFVYGHESGLPPHPVDKEAVPEKGK